jgi:hypothetical protein
MFQMVMTAILGIIVIGMLLTILFQSYVHINPKKKTS